MGMQEINEGMRVIWVEMQEIRAIRAGIQGIWEIRVEMQGIKVESKV